VTIAEREAIYAKMRADRLARPDYKPDLVRREVIATQLLAGIVVKSEWLS
jgi:hypothetical protein